MANSRDQLWAESSEWMGVPASVQYKETAKGTPFMEVGFKIEGHTKFVKLWLTEKTEAQTMLRLKDLGFNNNWEDPKLTRTEPCRLSMKHSEYNGKWYEEWSYWGEKPQVSIEKSKALALAASFRNAAGAPSASPAPRPGFKSATAPSAPPRPTAPVPTKPEVKLLATDEASAWEFWVSKTTDEEYRNTEWLKTVEEIKPKTPQDWHKVAERVDLPF